MGFWDKIKKFFGKKEPLALPEGNQKEVKAKDEFTCLTRKDGSTIRIIPVCDRVGNQCYQEVLDYYSGETRLIPQFSIEDTALEMAETNHGSSIARILMDIDYKLLTTDEKYCYQVANVILGSKRLADIIDNKEGYAGKITKEPEGTYKCTCSSGIVKGLAASRGEKSQIRAAAIAQQEADAKKEIMEKAATKTSHIKTNHAGQLHPNYSGDER